MEKKPPKRKPGERLPEGKAKEEILRYVLTAQSSPRTPEIKYYLRMSVNIRNPKTVVGHLDKLKSSGLLIPNIEKKGLEATWSVPHDLPAFKRVFEFLYPRHAKEFIESPYAQEMINSELLREIEKVWALKGHFGKTPLEEEVLEILRLSPTALSNALQGPCDLPEMPSYVWTSVSSEYFYSMLLSSLILDFSTRPRRGFELEGKIGIVLNRDNRRALRELRGPLVLDGHMTEIPTHIREQLREKPKPEKLLKVERSFCFSCPLPVLVEGNTEAGRQATGLGMAEEAPREARRGEST